MGWCLLCTTGTWADSAFVTRTNSLQILANPMTATDANRKGIVYVVTRMDWYWNLSSLLLKENTTDAGASAGLREQLGQRVIDLCKTLLAYQMKSVCSYFRKRFPQFLRSLVQWDSWDGDLQAVRDAENAVQKDSKMYNSQQIRSHLEQLVTLKDQEMELMRDVRRTLQQQLLAQLEEKDQQCLRDLHLTDPRRDKERISATKGGLLKDSYKWILNHPDFQQWQSNGQSRLLWIKGGAGKGKTMLLIGIINELEKSTSGSDSIFPSFFLCQSTSAELNNATAVLRGLIYMLIIQQSCLISYVREDYKREGDRLFKGDNAFYYLSKIFKKMVCDPKLTEAYLIIDALDECNTDLKQLLNLIIETTSSSIHVKWIVSSRERPDIEQQLAAGETGMKLSLEVNAELVSQAIGAYIEYKVSKLSLLRHNSTLQAHVRQQLYDKADGTFLWVALVTDELQNIFLTQDVTRVLNSVGSGLTPLYDRMMAQIQEHKWYSESCCHVLAVTILAHRPLHLLELRTLAGLGSSTMDELSRLVHLCGSFLTVQENHVYLIHQSAKDYLTINATGKIYPNGQGPIHFDIFTRSVAAMSETLRRDIYELGRSGVLVNEIKPQNPDSLAAVRYSCVHWVKHLCLALEQVSDYKFSDYGIAFVFFKEHFLHWLESLSLSRSLPDAISSIRQLQGVVTVRLQRLHLRHVLTIAVGVGCFPT
jgi:hypothetical protein